VLDKVRRGLEDARVNGTLSQLEVETRLSKHTRQQIGRKQIPRSSSPSAPDGSE